MDYIKSTYTVKNTHVINDAGHLAKQFLPDEYALGKRLQRVMYVLQPAVDKLQSSLSGLQPGFFV
jgi:hypothetical protein